MTRRSARRWIAIVVALVVGFGVATALPYVMRPPLVVGQDAITDAATVAVPVTLDDAGGEVIVARPPSGVAESDLLVVVYPGGLVRPQAYEWLARALAARGHVTVIPEMPLDLAVLAADRASVLIDRYGAGKKVVLAGHSLGGAMASQYVADQIKAGRSDAVAGLVLMAAYPPDGVDFSGTALKAVSFRAENDGVADRAAVEGALAVLPDGTDLVVVPGAVHSFFGRYGPQSGDGIPTTSRADAEKVIRTATLEFLAGL